MSTIDEFRNLSELLLIIIIMMILLSLMYYIIAIDLTSLFSTTNMSLVMFDVMQTLYTTVDSKDLVIYSYS